MLGKVPDEYVRAHTAGELKPLPSPVRIMDHDPEWPRLFERESERIQSVLGGRALRIEHTGSTSVPGLPGKPSGRWLKRTGNILRITRRYLRKEPKYQTRMNRYVLTGAPGAGKTAVIRQLEFEGFSVVEEAATDIIALWQARGIAEPWTHPEFIDAIVSLQQTRERRVAALPEVPQFHDRSVVCTAALADYLGIPRPQSLMRELQRVRTQNIFQRSVLLLRNLGFVTPTAARKITYEDTVRFEQIHERTYRDFGFEIISIGSASVSDRVREIKLALSLDRA